MHVLVEYADSEEFFEDALSQFHRGGMIVRLDLTPPPELYSDTMLTILTPHGEVDLAAQVVQVCSGIGIAVAFDGRTPDLVELLQQADKSGFKGPPASHLLVSRNTPQRFAEGSECDASVPRVAESPPLNGGELSMPIGRLQLKTVAAPASTRAKRPSSLGS